MRFCITINLFCIWNFEIVEAGDVIFTMLGFGRKNTYIKKRKANTVYNQLLGSRLLGKSYGFSSGSFSFANLVPANATNHTQTRSMQL